MGFFGSDSKSTSSTTLTQQDYSVKSGGDLGTVVAPSGQLATDSGVNISITNSGKSSGFGGKRGTDITINQFPEEVENTIAGLINSMNASIAATTQVSTKSQDVLGEKLSEQTLGDTSILPKLALYGLLAVVAIVIGRRVLK